jgi:hypothetical protein
VQGKTASEKRQQRQVDASGERVEERTMFLRTVHRRLGKKTCNPRMEDDEEMNHVDTWEKSVLTGGNGGVAGTWKFALADKFRNVWVAGAQMMNVWAFIKSLAVFLSEMSSRHMGVRSGRISL